MGGAFGAALNRLWMVEDVSVEPWSRDRYGRRCSTREVVHAAPPNNLSLMPCCGLSPFDVPRWHCMTIVDALVTCNRLPRDPAC